MLETLPPWAILDLDWSKLVLKLLFATSNAICRRESLWLAMLEEIVVELVAAAAVAAVRWAMRRMRPSDSPTS